VLQGKDSDGARAVLGVRLRECGADAVGGPPRALPARGTPAAGLCGAMQRARATQAVHLPARLAALP
jgi:hypothetical protein